MADIFYNPGVTPQGGAYLYGGLSNLGAGLGQFAQDMIKKKQQAELDALEAQKARQGVGHLSQLGLINPDDALQFSTMNGKQQVAFFQEKSAEIAFDAARKAQLAQGNYQAAQTNHLNALSAPPSIGVATPPPNAPPGTPSVPYFQHGGQAQLLTTNPSKAGQKIYTGSGQEIGEYDEKGNPQYYPASALKQDDGTITKIDPIYDPSTGKVVAGKGVIRGGHEVIDLTSENPKVVTLDPTGMFYLDTSGKRPAYKPIPKGQLEAIQDAKAGSAPAPAPTPGKLQQLGKAFFSLAGVPMATPTPAATTLAVGTERTINGTPAVWDGKGWVAK